MCEFFVTIVNMSISASWIVLAVLLLRLLLKKAPKWINVLLWGIVAVRLICPFSFESALSLIPSTQTINPEVVLNAPVIDSGVTIIDNVVNPIIGETTISFQPEKGINLFQFIMPYLAGVWLAGIAVLLIYTFVSFLRLKSKIGTAVLLRDNIYQSEAVVSPFVLGTIKPKIYVPFNMNEQDMDHVIAHEQAHIRRKDHLWKPLGFLILTLHWFNPMVWLGYILLCRDIELACDEKVVKELNNEQRADYSQALLTCSVNRRMIAACPIAFGEVCVKDRVKSVLNYKKPAFWIIVVAIIVSIVTAVCFLTNPLNKGFGIEPESNVVIYEIEKHYYDKVVGADIANESNGYYDIAITKDMVLYKYFKTQEGTIDNSWIDIGKLVKQEDTDIIEALIKDNIPIKYKLLGIKEFYVALDESEIQSASCVIIMKNGDILFAEIPAYETENRYVSNLMKLKIKKSEIQNGTYKLSKEIYFNGAYSYVPDFENDRIEIKTNGGMHIYHFTGEVLSTGGLYKEVNLNKENFSNLFSDIPEWFNYESLDDLLKNNKKVWYHNTPDDIGGYPYMLLLQKDGSLYMTFADFENGTPTRVRYIYELGYEGNIENSYDSTVGGSEKLTWSYNPSLSHTSHYTRAFAFDCEYTYVDATCTGGEFWNLEAEGQPSDTDMHFEKGKTVYWTPGEGNGKSADKSEVTLTVYNGDTKVQQHTVIFECISRNYSSAGEYEIYLKDTSEFVLVYSDYGYLTFIERSSISNVGGADEPSNVIVNTTINGLKVKYPQFFNISTDGGLTVYIWQMSENNYKCYLANTSMEALSDNSFAYEVGATIAEMRAILTTYDIEQKDITVQPVINPLSSYYYEINDEYRAKIKKLFWNDTGSADSMLDVAFESTLTYAGIPQNSNQIFFNSLNREKLSISSVRHLPIFRLDTYENLESFKNTFSGDLTLDKGYDEVPSFNTATARYDKEFFEDNSLMVVYIDAINSTHRYAMQSVEHNGVFCVHIEETTKADEVDDALSGWFLTVTASDELLDGCTEFDADFNNTIDLYDGTQIPKLTVSCDGVRAEAVMGTSTWTYDNGDGTMQTINADSSHPLDRIDYLLPLALKVKRTDDVLSVVTMDFDTKPDSIKVNSWFIAENGNIKSFDTDVKGLDIFLNPSNETCIYEVVATWNSSKKYSGTVRYSFCVVTDE